ncbi:MAG: ArnT family glycosyltransferase [Candidatus Levyibacteriota bacterium]
MYRAILSVIIIISTFLLFYHLSDLMSFFGDQEWFYISGRDMILSGKMPLVGIASSHPWLHQGPFWTYVLAIIFSLTHFNPLAPGYFVAGVGVFTVGLIYLLGKWMFSVNTGLIAAFLYATSPLVIINAREPYHTSFIPLVVLLFIYVLYKWLSGGIKYFPLVVLLVACLYNFEISTTPFSLILIACLAFGIWKKKKFTTELSNKKILIISFFAWFIPMIPMLLYDRTHGFPQTVKFILWIVYRFARLFGYPDIHNDTVFTPLAPFLPFTAEKIKDLIFVPQQEIAIILFMAVFIYLSYCMYRLINEKKSDNALVALYLSFTIPFLSYLALHTSSDAYWPMFFPATFLAFAVGLEKLFKQRKLVLIGIVALLIIGFGNVSMLVNNNYFMTKDKYGYPFQERMKAAQTIVSKTQKKQYTIIGKGEGSNFASFTMPYEYLTWWLGHGPSKKQEKLKIFVSETNKGIIVTENK